MTIAIETQGEVMQEGVGSGDYDNFTDLISYGTWLNSV